MEPRVPATQVVTLGREHLFLPFGFSFAVIKIGVAGKRGVSHLQHEGGRVGL